MRRNWLLIGFAALIAMVLAWAWIDGGREPLRDVTQSVPLPESAR